MATNLYRSTRRVSCFSALVLLIVLATPREIQAQGMGALPDPISTRELVHYLGMLDLNDDQRVAAELEHATYKERFKALRESEFESLRKEVREVRSSGTEIPSRKQLKSILAKQNRLKKRIASLDKGLFDAINVGLSAEAAARMSRVRMARQRQRHIASGFGGMSIATDIDLSRIARDTTLKLTEEELASIDGSLVPYETRLTRMVKSFHDDVSNMLLAILDRLEERGFTEESVKDNPQRMGEMFVAMRQAWEEVSVEMMKSAENIREHNRRASRSIARLLSPETGFRFRRRYFETAYDERLGREAQSETRKVLDAFAKAARLTGISSEIRAGVKAAGEQFAATDDRLMGKLADLIDESQANFTNPVSQEEPADSEEELENLRAERLRLVENAQVTLHALMGADAIERLERPGDEQTIDHEMRELIGAVAGEAPATTSSARDVAQMVNRAAEEYELARQARRFRPIAPEGPDSYIPGPISDGELHQYARTLNLDEGGWALLDALHDGYMKSHGVVQQELIDPALEAIRSQSARDENTGQLIATGVSIEQTFAKRRSAFNAVKQLDDSFFDDIQMAIASPDQDDAMRRIRLTRGWVQYVGRRGAGDFGWSLTSELDINPIELVDGLGLGAEDAARADAVLLEHESEITNMVRSVYETSYAADLAGSKVRTDFSWDLESEETNLSEEEMLARRIARSREWRQKISEAGKPLREALQQLARLSRSLVDDIAAQVSSQWAWSIRNAYDGAAFPQAYGDDLALEPNFRLVTRLKDLTPEQRGEIQAIADDYFARYEEVTNRLVEAYRESDFALTGFSMSQGDAWSRLQNKLDPIRFERNELNQATINIVRRVLTDAQLARFPMLAEDM